MAFLRRVVYNVFMLFNYVLCCKYSGNKLTLFKRIYFDDLKKEYSIEIELDDILQQIEVKVISNKSCKKYLNGENFSDNMLCAQAINNAGICKSDYGKN